MRIQASNPRPHPIARTAPTDPRRPTSRGVPAGAAHLPAAVSAYLSPTGVLTWEGTPALRADAHLRPSRMAMPRRINAELCQLFAALADGEKEKIRRFAARWGPLRYPRSDGG